MKKIGNSGSTIVEAAVVMPIVIMAILATILISIFLLYSTFHQVSIHWELIDKEGQESKTKNVYEVDKRTYETSGDFKNGKACMYISEDYKTIGGGLLPENLQGRTEGRIYEINEKETIGYFDFFKGQVEK